MEGTRRCLTRLALGLLAVALPLTASAAPTLFYDPSDMGVAPTPGAPPGVEIGSSESVYLYLDNGPASAGGTPCDTMVGAGDETCGAQFEITVDENIEITAFFVDGAISSPNKVEYMITPDNRTLRVALVTTSPALGPGPTRLGSVEIDSSQAAEGRRGTISHLKTVDADLELETVCEAACELFVVPEPGFLAALLPGIGLTLLLARRRGRQRG